VKGDAYTVGRWVTGKYKSLTPIYSNERRISETDNVPTVSSIFVLISSLHIKIKIFYW
jgi:hypothetical protein